MAYDTETFMPLHELSESGVEEHRRLMELEADRILFRHQHPFRYLVRYVREEILGLEPKD